MSYSMFIDDERFPTDEEMIICRASKSAIDTMNLWGCPTFISFDHDLGGDDTAIAVVDYMINRDMDSGEVFIPEDFEFEVHSQNPIGKANIESKLNSYLKFRKVRRLL